LEAVPGIPESEGIPRNCDRFLNWNEFPELPNRKEFLGIPRNFGIGTVLGLASISMLI
jgi:hypothetical protein